MKHVPVLLDKVLETLGDISGCTIVDCTFGAGGYTRAFLDAGANVIAMDRDPNVLRDSGAISEQYPGRFKFIAAPFSELKEHITVAPDAIVFDFGVSSMQIDNAERGFSFRFDGPLDMRMESDGQSAAELIENTTVSDLTEILREYGDVKKAGILARVIKDAKPKTTFELKNLIHVPKDVAPVFQALRIAVNDELGEIKNALDAIPALINPGGMCICVTFHSLEDRLVKKIFREWTTPVGNPRLPVLVEPKFKLLRTFTPSDDDIQENQRARSAHLRAVIKSY